MEILRLQPQNGIVKQSLKGEEMFLSFNARQFCCGVIHYKTDYIHYPAAIKVTCSVIRVLFNKNRPDLRQASSTPRDGSSGE